MATSDDDRGGEEGGTTATGEPAASVTFRAFGRAHPERLGWWFDLVGIDERQGDAVLRSLRAEMVGSQFCAALTVPADDAPDPMDAKVILEDVVRTAADTIGLFGGCVVDIEVVQLEVPDGSVRVLDSSFGGLELEHTADDFKRVLLGAQLVRGIRLGLVDFRLAIRVPHDTLFLAYRGLDGVRADLAEREGVLSEKKSWERMREVVGIDRASIDAIKPGADLRRHGSAVAVTHEEREVALGLLQRGLVGYTTWCAGNVPALRDVLATGSFTAE